MKITLLNIVILIVISGCTNPKPEINNPQPLKGETKGETKGEIKTNAQNKHIELIIVFKKETTTENAKDILNKSKVKYRTGMDSSRGKAYFYNTGDKFILDFKNKEERKKFISKYKNLKEVHEIYKPNWKIQKD